MCTPLPSPAGWYLWSSGRPGWSSRSPPHAYACVVGRAVGVGDGVGDLVGSGDLVGVGGLGRRGGRGRRGWRGGRRRRGGWHGCRRQRRVRTGSRRRRRRGQRWQWRYQSLGGHDRCRRDGPWPGSRGMGGTYPEDIRPAVGQAGDDARRDWVRDLGASGRRGPLAGADNGLLHHGGAARHGVPPEGDHTVACGGSEDLDEISPVKGVGRHAIDGDHSRQRAHCRHLAAWEGHDDAAEDLDVPDAGHARVVPQPGPAALDPTQ